jgi:SNF2 family DNA or RNA helicase
MAATGWLKMVEKSTKSTEARALQSRTGKRKSVPLPTVKRSSPKPPPATVTGKAKAHQGVPPMYVNQEETVPFLLENPSALDASDPGTGKTRSLLEAWAIRRRKDGGALLVIAPKSILQTAWGDDIDTFFPGEFRYSCAYANNRDLAFERDADIYITNTDAVKYLDKQKPKFFSRFDEVCVDESTSFKHRTSQRSKALDSIKKHFDWKRCMTATPNSRTIMDFWNQMYFLDGGERLGKNYFQFRQFACESVQVGPRPEMVQWQDKEGIEEVIGGMLSDITIRHIFEECQDIPPNVERTKYFELNPKHQRQYEELKALSTLALEEQNDEVIAVNAAVLTNKLLQLSSGAVYSEGGYARVSDERYELILELVMERQHSCVFFNWQHQKVELCKLAETLGVKYEVIDGTVVSDRKRTEIVHGFQEGRYQVLFLQPQSAGHGLTLTKGTATIWASPVYQPDVMRQGIGRVYRAGQEHLTENIMICARNTLEGHVYKVMKERGKKMRNLLSMLKG